MSRHFVASTEEDAIAIEGVFGTKRAKHGNDWAVAAPEGVEAAEALRSMIPNHVTGSVLLAAGQPGHPLVLICVLQR